MTPAALVAALTPLRARKGMGVYLASTGERVALEDVVGATMCRSCFADPFTLDAKLAAHVECCVVDQLLALDQVKRAGEVQA